MYLFYPLRRVEATPSGVRPLLRRVPVPASDSDILGTSVTFSGDSDLQSDVQNLHGAGEIERGEDGLYD